MQHICAFVMSKYLQALHLAQELSEILFFEQHLWTNKSLNISATFLMNLQQTR